jgi:hypothetical protein
MHSQDIKTKNYWDQILNWPISKPLENTLQVSFKMLQINFRCPFAGDLDSEPAAEHHRGFAVGSVRDPGTKSKPGISGNFRQFWSQRRYLESLGLFYYAAWEVGLTSCFPLLGCGSCTKVSSLDLLLVVVSRHQASPMQRFVLHHAKTQKASHANMRAIVSSKGKVFMSKTRRSRSWTVKAAFANCRLDSYLNSLFRYDIYIIIYIYIYHMILKVHWHI